MEFNTSPNEFRELFERFITGLIEASGGTGLISANEEILEPLIKTSIASDATIPRRLVSLFERKSRSYGLRLAPNVLYILLALLMRFPYSRGKEKLVFSLLDVFLLYQDTPAVAKQLTKIAQTGIDDDDEASLAEAVVSEDALHKRRAAVCKGITLLSLTMMCNRDMARDDRRLASRVASAMIQIDAIAASTIQENPACRHLGELLREDTDYVLRFLVADLIRELLNKGLPSHNFWPTSIDNTRAPAIPAEPHSHSLWLGEVLESLSTVETISNDRVIKLQKLDVGQFSYEDKAANVLAIFSDTITFILPGGADSPLQLIEVCTKHASLDKATIDGDHVHNVKDDLVMITIDLPKGDGDRYIKGTRKAVDSMRFGLADLNKVDMLAQVLQQFSERACQSMNHDPLPPGKDIKDTSEKQSLAFAAMTLSSEDEAITSDIGTSSFMSSEANQQEDVRPFSKSHRPPKHNDQDLPTATNSDMRHVTSTNNRTIQLRGRRLTSLTEQNRSSPEALRTPQSSDLDDASMTTEQESESPSFQASQGQARRQLSKSAQSVVGGQVEHTNVEGHSKDGRSHGDRSLMSIPEVASFTHFDRALSTQVAGKQAQDGSAEPVRASPVRHMVKNKASNTREGVSQPRTPTHNSMLAADLDTTTMDSPIQAQSSKLGIRKIKPSKSHDNSHDGHSTQDIYNLGPEEEFKEGPDQVKVAPKQNVAKSQAAVPQRKVRSNVSKASKATATKSKSHPAPIAKQPKVTRIKTAAATRTRRAAVIGSTIPRETGNGNDEEDPEQMNKEVHDETHLEKLGQQGQSQKQLKGKARIDAPAIPSERLQNKLSDTDNPMVISSASTKPQDGHDHDKHMGSDLSKVGTEANPTMVKNDNTMSEGEDDDVRAEDSYPHATASTKKINPNSNEMFGSMLEELTRPPNRSLKGSETPFGNKRKFVQHVNKHKSVSPQKLAKKNYSRTRGLRLHDIGGSGNSDILQQPDVSQILQPEPCKADTSGMRGTVLEDPSRPEEDIDSHKRINNNLHWELCTEEAQREPHQVQDLSHDKRSPGSVAAPMESELAHNLNTHSVIDSELVTTDTHREKGSELPKGDAVDFAANASTPVGRIRDGRHVGKHDSGTATEHIEDNMPLEKSQGRQLEGHIRVSNLLPHYDQGPGAASASAEEPREEVEKHGQHAPDQETPRNIEPSHSQDQSMPPNETVIHFDARGVVLQDTRPLSASTRKSLPAALMPARGRSKSPAQLRRSVPMARPATSTAISTPTKGSASAEIAVGSHQLVSHSDDDDEYTIAYEEAQRRSGRSNVSVVPSASKDCLPVEVPTVLNQAAAAAYLQDLADDFGEGGDTITHEESLDSMKSTEEEDPEYLESQSEPEHLDLTSESTKATQPVSAGPNIELPHLSDTVSFPTTRKIRSAKMALMTKRTPIGLNRILLANDVVLDQVTFSLRPENPRELEPGTLLVSKPKNNPSKTPSPQIRRKSKLVMQVEREYAPPNKEPACQASQVKNKLMPPPRRLNLTQRKKPVVPPLHTVPMTGQKIEEYNPKAMFPNPALKPRRIEPSYDLSPMTHSTVEPVGTPHGFNAILNTETSLIDRGICGGMAETTPKHHTTATTGRIDADTTLVNDVSLPPQSVLGMGRHRSGTTEDTATSSEPESEGTPAPQHRRSEADQHGMNNLQQSVRLAIMNVIDSVIVRLGAEEDAIGAQLAVYQRGGQFVLQQHQDFIDSRLKHETGKMKELLQMEQQVLNTTVTHCMRIENPLTESFLDIDTVLTNAAQRKKELLARIDDVVV